MALVRVLLDNGWEVSVGEEYAESSGLVILDKPAVSRWGRALAATAPTSPQPPPISPETDNEGVCPDVQDLSVLFENGLI